MDIGGIWRQPTIEVCFKILNKCIYLINKTMEKKFAPFLSLLTMQCEEILVY